MAAVREHLRHIISKLRMLEAPPEQKVLSSVNQLAECTRELAQFVDGQEAAAERLREHVFAQVPEEMREARRALSRLEHTMRTEDGAALSVNLADAIELVLKLTRGKEAVIDERPELIRKAAAYDELHAAREVALLFMRDGVSRLRRSDGSEVALVEVLRKAEAYDELHARLWKRLPKPPEGRRREDVPLAELSDFFFESAAQMIHDTHGRVRRYMFDLLGWKEDGEHKGASAMDAAVELGKKLAAVEAAEAATDWSLKVAAAARELGKLARIVRLTTEDDRAYVLKVLQSLAPEIGHLNELADAMGCSKNDPGTATWMAEEVRRSRELLKEALPSIAKGLKPGLSVPLEILSDVVAKGREKLCDAVPVDPLQRPNLTFASIVEVVVDALNLEREAAKEAHRKYTQLLDATLTLRNAVQNLGVLEQAVERAAAKSG